MSSKWIIYGLLFIGLLILMNFIGPFKGTGNSDFPDEYQPRDSNPLPACPGSPNCARLSVPMQIEAGPLFEASLNALGDLGAEELDSDRENLQLDAVFKIPIFGFRDDFSVRIADSSSDGETFLHLSSRSRTGEGDLGVNRRRINSFLESVQSNL